MAMIATVREYMTTKLFKLTPDTEILAAVKALVKQGISGAPVVDRGKLVGIITERDCLGLLARGVDHREPTGTVAQFMSTDVETIPPDMDLYYAAGMFLKKPFRRFPVVDDGALVGQLSRHDVLRAMQELLGSHRVRNMTPLPR